MLCFFFLEKFARLRSTNQHHGHSHATTQIEKKNKDEKKKEEKTKVGGILNIIADTAHNFTDGMAIAASFLVSDYLGYSTTIAVFFHEIPHEIGDYAILIQSGFSKNGAMLMQCVTAIGAFLGCLFGLIAGGNVESANWILPFTAGGFIYIATVDVIPELFEDTNWPQTIVEFIMMAFGVGMMYLIAIYE